MATVLLLRHGRTTANAEGVLAGWTPGVPLDEVGRVRAKEVALRIAALPVAGIVTSPLERCRETADILAAELGGPDLIHTDLELAECRYGDWTGARLDELRQDPLWQAVEHVPSSVTFPNGESIAAMQARALAAISRWNRRFGADAVYVAVTHGDVIKSVLADALGMHLDMFQRIVVDPCSVSVVRYGPLRPVVLRLNDVGGDFTALLRGEVGAARVGGGAAG